MASDPEALTARQQLLLKEYELCQDAAQSLESTIWQTSAAIGIGSIGSLILTVAESPRPIPATGIAVLVVGTNCIWWHMARRWWSIQHAKYLRMRHIEVELDIYQTRYVDYLDGFPKVDESGLSDQQKRDIQARQSNHQEKGVQEYLKYFRCLLLVAWLLYMVSFCRVWSCIN